MNKTNLSLSIIALILLSAGLVYASGVASPYYGGRPLTMAAGETKVVNLNLQNMIGTEDVTFKAAVKQGSEIASISRDTYLVRAGTYDTMAPLVITLPGDAIAGTVYKVAVEFKTVSTTAGEGVAMGTGMDIAFDVVVAEKVSKFPTTTVLVIVIIVIIIIIAWIMLKKKKRR
jgi:hypothetical protein